MLKTRVLTAFVLVAIVALLFFGMRQFFPFALSVVFAFMAIEWIRGRKQVLTADGEVQSLLTDQYSWFYAIFFAIVFFCLSIYGAFLPKFVSYWGGVFWVFAFFCLLIPQSRAIFLHQIVIYWLVGLSLLVPAWEGAAFLFVTAHGLLLYPVLVIAASDTGAFFAGKAFGRYPLAKTISPKKTWEGVFGGLLVALLVTLVYVWVSVRFLPMTLSMGKWFFFSILIAIAGIVGDLFESRIKRLLAIKDFGRCLPGHGGLLDRFDSHLAGFVVAGLLFRFFA